MELDKQSQEELRRKYRLAGKIRLMSFSLLLLFLLIMKFIGGYSYLNSALISLILIEAILNQPYDFIIHRVGIRRLQYYQMSTDIIAVSWILYYMGGIEAPLVSIGYYVVVLWAGVVSSVGAVLFATILSAALFSAVVILGYTGIFASISYYNYSMSLTQMLSELCGNVSFLFAFGYFCARSSNLIKLLERKRNEDALRYTHKLLATGNLIGNTTHDLQNYLASIKGCASLLSYKVKEDTEESQMLNTIQRMEEKISGILTKLSRFSKRPRQEFEAGDIHRVIEDAFELTWPLLRYSDIVIEKGYGLNIPLITMDRDQMQEVFVALIFNSLDAVNKNGKLSIRTSYLQEAGMIEVVFSDTGRGIRREDLDRISEPFFTTKNPEEGLGIGLSIAYLVIARHKGNIEVTSKLGKGTTFTIKLPVTPSAP